MLDVFHPPRAAGGEQRQHAFRVHPVQQFMRLFNDGQICAEIGIKHPIYAETAQRGRDLAGDDAAGLHAELFAQRHTHRRRDLSHHVLFGIVDRLPHSLLTALFTQCANGADHHTLAAEHAGDGVEAAVHGRRHGGLKSATHEIDGAYVLHLMADAHAAAAEDAFFRIALDGGAGQVDFGSAPFALITVIAHLVLFRKFLQLAVAVAHAHQTILRVIGDQQLDDGLARPPYLRRVGLNLHPFGHRKSARRNQTALSLHFHHADAAGTGGSKVFQIAQRGDVHAFALRHGENGLARVGPNLFVVYCNRHTFLIGVLTFTLACDYRACAPPRRPERNTDAWSPVGRFTAPGYSTKMALNLQLARH
ncbi:MAG: hypothetical protein BWY83_01472 [bacterium ADurb.Bin478]|nr:MAG: hypothetical protein BWY83_01472 [bacterium ADurb.Bin478]